MCASLTNGSVSLCSCVCELIASIASHIVWRRCHFTVPMRHLWYFVANSLFMFHAHQPNASASDKSCKYTHGLAKCLFNYNLFWLLWTCLIVLVLCTCRCRLGCESKRNRRGSCGLWNHPSRFCSTYGRGEVASSGNSRLSAWKRTKDKSFLRSHSHTWDMRWRTGFSSAHLRFSGVAVLWQRAAEANCVGSSQTENLHGPPFVCLFGISALFL